MNKYEDRREYEISHGKAVVGEDGSVIYNTYAALV